jgi:uncharacterized protein YecT (DUF1311 family)
MIKNVAILFFLFVVCKIHAQDDPVLTDTTYKSLDRKYDSCCRSEQGSTTIGMADCAVSISNQWHARMDKYYKLLVENCATDEEKQSFKNAQSSWEYFIDAENNYYVKSLFNRDGTMWVDVRADLKMSLVRDRALQLQSYFEISTQH